MAAPDVLHTPSVPPPANPGKWAKVGDLFTTVGTIATAIGTALAAAWKGWKEWKAAKLRKRIQELQKIDDRISGKLAPLFDDLKTTLEMQVESLSVQSDRRHGENRDALGELSERVARVEERTNLMYGIIERRNSARD